MRLWGLAKILSTDWHCRAFKRSTYYYETQSIPYADEVEDEIEEIFNNNHKVYGSRIIKAELLKRGKRISRRKIC